LRNAADTLAIGFPASTGYTVQIPVPSGVTVSTNAAPGTGTLGSALTSNFTSTTNGLANSALGSVTTTTNGKVNWGGVGSNDAFFRNCARALSSGVPSSSTYWMSMLINQGTPNQTGTLGDGFLVGGFGSAGASGGGFITNGATQGAYGLYFGFSQNNNTANTGSIVIRCRDASGTIVDNVISDGTVFTNIVNQTHLLVAKIDVNTSGTLDNISWWLDPSQAGDENNLNNSTSRKGSFTGDVLSAGSDFATLGYGTFHYRGTGFFDEARLSTDVLGLNFASIPEPSSLALVPVVGMMMGRRRRA
jgi:hypothetical protein